MVVMRGGLAAIQQTLTPEAASVLSNSIAEAGRRNHGQTTPLHVAATLLVSPTGFLRQACIRSHPNSSHPLQCRALELCFSVALERLPTAQPASSGSAPPHEPPISNALMAALKRAQAHQRRGCPEQQQQPLLAVKVELEQLIISILDDPSVSRVMREASFSSPAVKAAIEQAITSQPNSGPGIGMGFGGAGVGPRNLYLNPRLQQQQHHQQQGRGGGDDVRRVLDILLKPRKRNPVLVGESEPRDIVKEVFRRIENDEIRDGILKGASVISVEKEVGLLDRVDMPNKVKQLDGVISNKMLENSNGVILDLGDLKWLVDQGNNNQGVSDSARGVVCEMGKILRKFCDGKIWLIGIATCETYLRCQVYHPSMEIDWDLQVVSIVSKPPLSGLFPRLGSNGGIISSSVECLSPMKNFPMPVSSSALMTRRVPENLDPLRKFSCCPQCSEKYNQELAKLAAAQSEKSCSDVKSDADKQSLPLWLQNAKSNTNDLAQDKDRDLVLRQRTQELQKKWNETCLQLHPNFHQGIGSEKIIPSPLLISGLCNPNLLGRQPVQPKLAQPKALGDALQLNISPPMVCQLNSNRPPSPPGSPVGTDLVLGQTKLVEKTQDKIQKPQLKDLLGCISSDTDSYKKLLKGLMEKVWWQTEAASAIASAITQCKMGNGKRRLGGSKGDIWLLFLGPDRIGKKKMAGALSELVCGMGPTLISLGSTRDGDESDTKFRGKTAIDRIAEAVRRHPFSVIVLQDIDEANMLVQGSIKRAMERGRISDSHGREISLGNVIFILTSNWVPDQFKSLLSKGGLTLNEEKLISLASGGWQLRISIGEKNTGKRSPPNWLHEGRSTKQRKEAGSGLTFDLNQMADNDDDRLDGSHNSSDLTVDHEDEHGQENRGSPTTSSPPPEMLLGSVDEVIIFKPVDFTSIKNNIQRTILARFSGIAGDQIALKLNNEALERILSGVWLGQTTIESWIDKVMIPSMYQLKSTIMSKSVTHDGKTVAHLELDKETDNRGFGDWLPSRISVVDDAN